MILTAAEFLLWIAVTFIAGSFTTLFAMFILIYRRDEPFVLSNAEDWAQRMAAREPYRMDLTLADRVEPTKLRAVK